MLRIYLPKSTDLKLCSDVPTWTFVTIFKSRHLDPNNWVLANGSKTIYQTLGHLLGPGSRVLGLEPRFNLIFMHLDFWDPGPGLRTCSFGFLRHIQKVQTLIEWPVNSKKPIQSGLPNDITLKMPFRQSNMIYCQTFVFVLQKYDKFWQKLEHFIKSINLFILKGLSINGVTHSFETFDPSLPFHQFY